MKKSQCKAMFLKRGNYRESRCERSAGHGPDGAYCIQHALKYAVPETETTWYGASIVIDEIAEVKVIKETEKQVTIRYRLGGVATSNKVGDYTAYFPTRKEAVNWLIKSHELKVAEVQVRLDYEQKLLKEVISKFGGDQ